MNQSKHNEQFLIITDFYKVVLIVSTLTHSDNFETIKADCTYPFLKFVNSSTELQISAYRKRTHYFIYSLLMVKMFAIVMQLMLCSIKKCHSIEKYTYICFRFQRNSIMCFYL